MTLLSKEDLLSYFESGCKPSSQYSIGTEHEKFVFHREILTRLPYDGAVGIQSILEGLCQLGWQPVYEKDNPIALVRDKASVSLEPGGQLELSGAPLKTLHDTQHEFQTHLDELKQVAKKIPFFLLNMGFDPITKREDVPWMPKERYALMRSYMPTRGNLGLDMMTRTATVQVNLDYSSELDMVKKMRVGMALQPLAVALFAYSSLKEGVDIGYQSYRSHVWEDTDPDRCGALDFVFDPAMGFERYVDYILDVPMYFIYRNGTYHNALGLSFKKLMEGKLDSFPRLKAEVQDWEDHVTVAFPDVRLKKYIEMRGADTGPWGAVLAVPAFWVGLLYDAENLAYLHDMVMSWTVAERHHLHVSAPKLGLHTLHQGKPLFELAEMCVLRAQAGLKRRKMLNKKGADESIYLAPLLKMIESRVSFSDQLLRSLEQG
jgi:glutamate--cysteine ligase